MLKNLGNFAFYACPNFQVNILHLDQLQLASKRVFGKGEWVDIKLVTLATKAKPGFLAKAYPYQQRIPKPELHR